MRKMALGLMPKALFTGSVDAAVVPSPSNSVTLRGAAFRPLFNSALIPGEVLTVFVVEKNFLRLNQNIVVALLRSWSAAHAEARLRPQSALALLAERERVTVDEFRAAEQGLRYFTLSDQVEMLQPEGYVARNIEAVRDLQEKLHLIPRGSITPKVTSTYVQAAQ
jgi:NitT/TauT family transport system substrate-binding protein